MPSAASSPDLFAYERLVTENRQLIQAGTLRPGDRIPSVRRMSAQRGVSIPTVLQAYRLLEARRVIGARPQSGFYVLPQARAGAPEPGPSVRLPGPGEITTGDLIMRTLEVVADPALIPLGTALPDPELLPAARSGARPERRARPRVLGQRRVSQLHAHQRRLPLVATQRRCARRPHRTGAGDRHGMMWGRRAHQNRDRLAPLPNRLRLGG